MTKSGFRNFVSPVVAAMSLAMTSACTMADQKVASTGPETPLAQAGSEKAKGDLHYTGTFAFEPDKGALTADIEVEIANPGLESITFLLNAMVGEARVSGADVLSVKIEPMESFNGFVNAYEVVLRPTADGAPRRIAFSYSGVPIPEQVPLEINSIEPRHIELTVDSFWFPFDRSFQSSVTTDLDIDVAGEWVGVAPDTITPDADGFRLEQYLYSRDISFSLLGDPAIFRRGPYALFDARAEKGGRIEELAEGLQNCTTYLNGLAGADDVLPSASVVLFDRESGGYSRRTLIALSDIAEASVESTYQFICHELAHFWSNADASGIENWHNEGFADALANFALRDAFGEEVYEKRLASYRDRLGEEEELLGPIWTADLTERPIHAIAYRAAPLAFDRLERHMGTDNFARFARSYMTDGITTTPEMLAAIEANSDPEARKWFADLLAREATLLAQP